MSDRPVFVNHADFVSCYKGRSYALDDEEAVLISDTESMVAGPPLLTGHHSGCNGQVLQGGAGAGSLATTGPVL